MKIAARRAFHAISRTGQRPGVRTVISPRRAKECMHVSFADARLPASRQREVVADTIADTRTDDACAAHIRRRDDDARCVACAFLDSSRPRDDAAADMSAEAGANMMFHARRHAGLEACRFIVGAEVDFASSCSRQAMPPARGRNTANVRYAVRARARPEKDASNDDEMCASNTSPS